MVDYLLGPAAVEDHGFVSSLLSYLREPPALLSRMSFRRFNGIELDNQASLALRLALDAHDAEREMHSLIYYANTTGYRAPDLSLKQICGSDCMNFFGSVLAGDLGNLKPTSALLNLFVAAARELSGSDERHFVKVYGRADRADLRIVACVCRSHELAHWGQCALTIWDITDPKTRSPKKIKTTSLVDSVPGARDALNKEVARIASNRLARAGGSCEKQRANHAAEVRNHRQTDTAYMDSKGNARRRARRHLKGDARLAAVTALSARKFGNLPASPVPFFLSGPDSSSCFKSSRELIDLVRAYAGYTKPAAASSSAASKGDDNLDDEDAAIQAGHADCARVLLEAGADAGANVKHTTPSGATALMAASNGGNVDCVHLLLEAGADATGTGGGIALSLGSVLAVVLETSRWNTRLHHLELFPPAHVRQLLVGGADVLAGCGDGASTPIGLARRFSSGGGGGPVARANHALFPAHVRARAAEQLWLGQLLVALLDVWPLVMAQALRRSMATS
ncbi:hypothetical protein T492DRAFT_883514 [Pavlovales sp. CCMP2436]|nr:hypothetical protein T492DRAFT_883514 [Pavlovales sp. CCMP2436]